MVDALTWNGDEGRGTAAISFGEVPNNLWSGDVRMGKPAAFAARTDIRSVWADLGKWNISEPRGKETKSSIPLVAASERGEAQTEHHFCSGVRSILNFRLISEV